MAGRRRRTGPAPRALALLAGTVLAAAGCTSGGTSPGRPPAEPSTSTTASGTASGGTSGTASGGTSGTPSGTASGTASQPPVTGTPATWRTVADRLDVPWDLAFLPDRSALVTLRDQARVVRISPDGTRTSVPATGPDGRVPGVRPAGEGGLLGLTLSPRFATDHQVYLYTTTASDNRVVRATYDGTGLGPLVAVLTGIPKAGNHNGGRLRFGPDGMLYVGTGDAGRRDRARDRAYLGGKILRITPQGAPAPGNPFPGSPVWTLGHRNVQGLGWDAAGRMYASEFGQDRLDELNLIRPGGDYGWPVVEGTGGGPGMVDPLAVWPTDEASPSGIAVTPDAVWLAALRGERLWRVPLADGRVGTPHAYLVGQLGRLRDVEVAPDGTLWLLTNNTARGNPRPGDDRVVSLRLR